jgi:arylformamidase
MTTPPASGDPPALIDISILVNADTPPWPGDTPFSCRRTWEMSTGASVNVSAITSSPHVGTHADAPFHVDSRWLTSEWLPLEHFSGAAVVVDVEGRTGVLEVEDLGLSAEDLASGRILLRTGQSIAGGVFPEAWPVLSAGAIRALTDAGMRLLGVDAPSVDARDSRTLENHHALFASGASILENLELTAVSPGHYQLTAYPLRVAGLDAAPVRAVLEPVRAR